MNTTYQSLCLQFKTLDKMAQGVQTNGHAVEGGQSAAGQALELTVLGMNSGTSMVSALQAALRQRVLGLGRKVAN